MKDLANQIGFQGFFRSAKAQAPAGPYAACGFGIFSKLVSPRTPKGRKPWGGCRGFAPWKLKRQKAKAASQPNQA
jgi:hypothetical protein